mmetsp:Transcript_63319/g.72573  ORF Transcript_63319/g.72573 Transcript_63319/m.72573 type:complete len:106 (-) Transcript_63319:113-430(-)
MAQYRKILYSSSIKSDILARQSEFFGINKIDRDSIEARVLSEKTSKRPRCAIANQVSDIPRGGVIVEIPKFHHLTPSPFHCEVRFVFLIESLMESGRRGDEEYFC